ncbi:MAG: ComF family protein [Candidatus Omnitrophica bacterium]|nr:ComF family protein [Candidatus Omnitrophota bacterium]
MGELKREENGTMNMLSALIDLVYPPHCEICDIRLNGSERIICNRCFGKILVNAPPFCLTCGRMVPFTRVLKGRDLSRCPECKGRHSYLERMWAWGVYDGGLKTCLHLFKHKKRPYILDVFKEGVIDFIGRECPLGIIDIITPVPLDPVKQRDRTFNQSELIAGLIAGHYRKPLVGLLKKSKKTGPQHFLSKDERKENIKNAFTVRYPLRVKGKTILLVDDIFTTGATMNECSRILKDAGCRAVYGFALARGI